MNKFRASKESKQARLALMKVVGDQIFVKIHRKRPEFNINFLDEESDDEDDSKDVGDVVRVATAKEEKFRTYGTLLFVVIFLIYSVVGM